MPKPRFPQASRDIVVNFARGHPKASLDGIRRCVEVEHGIKASRAWLHKVLRSEFPDRIPANPGRPKLAVTPPREGRLVEYLENLKSLVQQKQKGSLAVAHSCSLSPRKSGEPRVIGFSVIGFCPNGIYGFASRIRGNSPIFGEKSSNVGIRIPFKNFIDRIFLERVNTQAPRRVARLIRCKDLKFPAKASDNYLVRSDRRKLKVVADYLARQAWFIVKNAGTREVVFDDQFSAMFDKLVVGILKKSGYKPRMIKAPDNLKNATPLGGRRPY